MKRDLFICRCGSLEHMFVVSADGDECFIEVHLAPAPWYKRVIYSIRYLFGWRSKWGDFDEILLDPETAVNLADKLLEWAQGEGTAFETSDVY
jgi:hypothetical protein